MRYCNIGERPSSAIVMGCMRIADKPLEQVEKVMFEALRAGVNTFDLADIYGGGDCEKVFGVAIRDLGIPRKEYLLQTKCGIRKESGKLTRYDFSKEYILQSVEGSLKRLNMDYIDLLLLHRPDTLVEVEEVAEVFERLQGDGKVRAFGVSNFSATQMQLFRSAGIQIATNQVQFSLAHTPLIDGGFNMNTYKEEGVTRGGDTLEYSRLKGIPLQAWSPLQYGKIEGSFLGNPKYETLNGELALLAEKYQTSAATIAIAWILRHPAFKQVVTGTVNPEHMESLCQAADIRLTHEEWYNLYLSTGKTLP